MQTSSQGGVFAMTEPCRECLGRGLVVDDPCAVCHGSGRGTRPARSRRASPPASRTASRSGCAAKARPASAAARTATCSSPCTSRPHPLFGRKGDNLTLTVPVRFDEAALGADITVPTPKSGPVTLKIPPGTPNGRTFRVKGRGAPRRDGT